MKRACALCALPAAAVSSLPTPVWDPAAHGIFSWNATWPVYRNSGDPALVPPPPAYRTYTVTGGPPIGGVTHGHANGGYNQAYYLMKGSSKYGTLDRSEAMRQFQEGMALDASQSPLPVGATDDMLAQWVGWDVGAACARISAPEFTNRSALVLVVDRFPAKDQNKSTIDMPWDAASLLVHDNSPSNRCWDGMNTYDRNTGKPCIDFQFVECTWRDSASGSELPLTATFFYPTRLLNAASNKWNVRFQLNYKTRPIRAVQATGSDGATVDAVFGYGAWVVNPVAAPFRIRVSYGDTDGSGGLVYRTSDPVAPSRDDERKTVWPVDAWRYNVSDWSHAENIPLRFES